jgi:hypothetical protein
VHFSKITLNEYHLALKEEFANFPPKVKLFQGLLIDWDEINTVISSNFLAPLKPNSIDIYEENIPSPCPHLDHLLQPVLSTLTKLSLLVSCKDGPSNFSSFTSILKQLCELPTLKLKCLELSIYVNEGLISSTEHVLALFRAFEGIFQSQCQTLEVLDFGFGFEVNKDLNFEGIQLQLPTFPRLQTLHMDMIMRKGMNEADYFPIVTPFDFCEKFPKLVELEIPDSESDLFTLRGSLSLTRGHPLKKLRILSHFVNNDDLFTFLYSSFPYIKELSVNEELLFIFDAGVETWVDTLRVLEIVGYSFPQNFHLGHLQSKCNTS